MVRHPMSVLRETGARTCHGLRGPLSTLDITPNRQICMKFSYLWSIFAMAVVGSATFGCTLERGTDEDVAAAEAEVVGGCPEPTDPTGYACTTNADCGSHPTTGQPFVCTTTFNPAILFQANRSIACTSDADCGGFVTCVSGYCANQFGHCVDPFYSTTQCDATDAIQADLNAVAFLQARRMSGGFPTSTQIDVATGPFHAIGVPYHLPPSTLKISDRAPTDGVALIVHRRLQLQGDGAVLNTPNNVTALQIADLASMTSVRDLSFTTPPNSFHTGVAIDVGSDGVELSRIRIDYFGFGIRQIDDDDSTSDGDIDRNLNSQQWSNIFIQNPWCSGVITSGTDTQAGLMSGIRVLGALPAPSGSTCPHYGVNRPEVIAGGVGFVMSSNLGNTYLGPLSEGSEVGYVIDGTPETIVGAYREVSDNLVQYPDAGAHANAMDGNWNVTIIGGNLAGTELGVGNVISHARTQLRFLRPMGATRSTSRQIAVTIPYRNQSGDTWARDGAMAFEILEPPATGIAPPQWVLAVDHAHWSRGSTASLRGRTRWGFQLAGYQITPLWFEAEEGWSPGFGRYAWGATASGGVARPLMGALGMTQMLVDGSALGPNTQSVCDYNDTQCGP